MFVKKSTVATWKFKKTRNFPCFLLLHRDFWKFCPIKLLFFFCENFSVNQAVHEEIKLFLNDLVSVFFENIHKAEPWLVSDVNLKTSEVAIDDNLQEKALVGVGNFFQNAAKLVVASLCHFKSIVTQGELFDSWVDMIGVATVCKGYWWFECYVGAPPIISFIVWLNLVISSALFCAEKLIRMDSLSRVESDP